jgi:hypothetical protein
MVERWTLEVGKDIRRSRPVYAVSCVSCCGLWQSRLLRSALHTLTARVAIFVILIHAAARAEDLALCCVIGVLEVGRLGHGIGRWVVDHVGAGEDLAELLEGFGVRGPVLLGELDVEADEHVAVVVVPWRRHTLAANHLDGICSGRLLAMPSSIGGPLESAARTLGNGLSGQNVDAQPAVVQVLDENGTTSESSY